jgi:hypothetical protein
MVFPDEVAFSETMTYESPLASVIGGLEVFADIHHAPAATLLIDQAPLLSTVVVRVVFVELETNVTVRFCGAFEFEIIPEIVEVPVAYEGVGSERLKSPKIIKKDVRKASIFVALLGIFNIPNTVPPKFILKLFEYVSRTTRQDNHLQLF